MDTPAFRTVPTNYSYKWLHASWVIAKKHYGDCLMFAIALMVGYVILSRLGMVGTVVGAIASPLLNLGAMLVTQRWLKGEPAVFTDFFQVFKDSEKIKQLTPLLITQTALALLSAYSVNFMRLGGLFYVPPFLIMLTNMVLFIVLPLLHFKNLSFGSAISSSINCLIGNLLTVLACFIVTILVIIAFVLPLMIPFLFVVMPATVTVSYIVYASLFEGLDVEALLPAPNPPAPA